MLKRGVLVREAINATERFSQGASMYHFSSDIGLSRARRQTPLRWTVGARADVSETGGCRRSKVRTLPCASSPAIASLFPATVDPLSGATPAARAACGDGRNRCNDHCAAGAGPAACASTYATLRLVSVAVATVEFRCATVPSSARPAGARSMHEGRKPPRSRQLAMCAPQSSVCFACTAFLL